MTRVPVCHDSCTYARLLCAMRTVLSHVTPTQAQCDVRASACAARLLCDRFVACFTSLLEIRHDVNAYSARCDRENTSLTAYLIKRHIQANQRRVVFICTALRCASGLSMPRYNFFVYGCGCLRLFDCLYMERQIDIHIYFVLFMCGTSTFSVYLANAKSWRRDASSMCRQR